MLRQILGLFPGDALYETYMVCIFLFSLFLQFGTSVNEINVQLGLNESTNIDTVHSKAQSSKLNKNVLSLKDEAMSHSW